MLSIETPLKTRVVLDTRDARRKYCTPRMNQPSPTRDLCSVGFLHRNDIHTPMQQSCLPQAPFQCECMAYAFFRLKRSALFGTIYFDFDFGLLITRSWRFAKTTDYRHRLIITVVYIGLVRSWSWTPCTHSLLLQLAVRVQSWFFEIFDVEKFQNPVIVTKTLFLLFKTSY